MKPENPKDETDFFGVLNTRRPERFWEQQRAGIMAALPKRKAAPHVAWALAPAFAALVLGGVWLLQHNRAAQAPAADSQMLEHLGLLNEMDLLERIPEGELI